MSLINTYVAVSQFVRKVSYKIKRKLIAKLEAELSRTEADLASAESKRSENMVSLHTEFYAENQKRSDKLQADIDALYAAFNKDCKQAAEAFEIKKASIAVVSQAIADDLKSRRAALSKELDELVG